MFTCDPRALADALTRVVSAIEKEERVFIRALATGECFIFGLGSRMSVMVPFEAKPTKDVCVFVNAKTLLASLKYIDGEFKLEQDGDSPHSNFSSVHGHIFRMLSSNDYKREPAEAIEKLVQTTPEGVSIRSEMLIEGLGYGVGYTSKDKSRVAAMGQISVCGDGDNVNMFATDGHRMVKMQYDQGGDAFDMLVPDYAAMALKLFLEPGAQVNIRAIDNIILFVQGNSALTVTRRVGAFPDVKPIIASCILNNPHVLEVDAGELLASLAMAKRFVGKTLSVCLKIIDEATLSITTHVDGEKDFKAEVAIELSSMPQAKSYTVNVNYLIAALPKSGMVQFLFSKNPLAPITVKFENTHHVVMPMRG